jgi:predicted DCC family thiol-disulfide oxidoreductase YuxK
MTQSQTDSATPHAIVLFDGVCNLCNATVNFVIDHDPADYFQFASQQSPAGQALLRQFDLSDNLLQTIVLIENGRAHLRSDAALRVARHLRGWPRAFSLGIVIPQFLRDAIYDFIAGHRYGWFGRLEACRMPSAKLKARFL